VTEPSQYTFNHPKYQEHCYCCQTVTISVIKKTSRNWIAT